MFGNIKTLVSISLVWYVCVVVRHKMMVWQGSCQVGCTWWKSCGVMADGFDAKKTSSVGFCFVRTRGSCGSEVFRSPFQRKV
jgi:hypothetical protein